MVWLNICDPDGGAVTRSRATGSPPTASLFEREDKELLKDEEDSIGVHIFQEVNSYGLLSLSFFLTLSLSLLTTSRFSMMYSVISAPPSSFGLAHSRSTKSLSQLVALGFPGFDGGSEGGEKKRDWSLGQ